jgi:hypothetical protein
MEPTEPDATPADLTSRVFDIRDQPLDHPDGGAADTNLDQLASKDGARIPAAFFQSAV